MHAAKNIFTCARPAHVTFAFDSHTFPRCLVGTTGSESAIHGKARLALLIGSRRPRRRRLALRSMHRLCTHSPRSYRSARSRMARRAEERDGRREAIAYRRWHTRPSTVSSGQSEAVQCEDTLPRVCWAVCWPHVNRRRARCSASLAFATCSQPDVCPPRDLPASIVDQLANLLLELCQFW